MVKALVYADASHEPRRPRAGGAARRAHHSPALCRPGAHRARDHSGGCPHRGPQRQSDRRHLGHRDDLARSHLDADRPSPTSPPPSPMRWASTSPTNSDHPPDRHRATPRSGSRPRPGEPGPGRSSSSTGPSSRRMRRPNDGRSSWRCPASAPSASSASCSPAPRWPSPTPRPSRFWHVKYSSAWVDLQTSRALQLARPDRRRLHAPADADGPSGRLGRGLRHVRQDISPPRHRQPLRPGRIELLADCPRRPLPVSDRWPTWRTRPARSHRPSWPRPTRSPPPSAASRASGRPLCARPTGSWRPPPK